MTRRIQDAVLPDYPIRVQPETFPTNVPRTTADATRLLDRLRPTSGNLVASEAWRRIVGGRNRFNRHRQQLVRARRKAILAWLMRNRMYFKCDVLNECLLTDRIIVRHGDGAMLARAFGIGKATVCRDLSALQAVHPILFGSRSCGIGYEEYMSGWRYAHRMEMGNEQPKHNLRYPRNQAGPQARTDHRVDGNLHRSSTGRIHSFTFEEQAPVDRSSEPEKPCLFPSVDDFLGVLKEKCPQQDVPPLTEAHRWFILKTISVRHSAL